LEESFKMLEFNLRISRSKQEHEIELFLYYEIFFQIFLNERFDRVTKGVLESRKD